MVGWRGPLLEVLAALLVAVVAGAGSHDQTCGIRETAPLGLHKIREGRVGVYWRWGQLQSRLVSPGYHWMMPLGIEEFLEVPVTMETALLRNVPCGTSGGVMLDFDEVEVVYRLQRQDVLETIRNYSETYAQTWIRDPLPALMNEVCGSLSLHDVHIGRFADMDDMLRAKMSELLAAWAPGLQIITVRLVKPNIPASVQDNFDQVGECASKLKTVTAHQTVVLRAAEKDRSLALLNAEKQLEVAVMHAEADLLAAERSVGISNVTVQTAVSRMIEKADAEFYGKQREAEANRHRLSENFLDLQRRLHFLKNMELNIGPAVPAAIVDDDGVDEDDRDCVYNPYQEEGGIDEDVLLLSLSKGKREGERGDNTQRDGT